MSDRRRLRYVAVGVLSTGLLFIGPALAWAEDSITLDFVRHAQSVDNQAGIIDTAGTGTGLTTPEGVTEAQDVGALLAQHGPYAGLFSSDQLRAIETADYISTALNHMPVQPPLPGLDEINAGIYEGSPVDSLQGILYLLTPMAWVFGAELTPIPGSPDVNGFVFDDRFTNAVDTIYDQTATGGNPTDIAVSSEGAITAWTLMNVNNPDFSVVFNELLTTGQLLPNAGQVVVEGNPGDWTLVSYNGQSVPADPGLPTELFVDVRNLIETPQLADYNIYEALLNGDPTMIEGALQTGLNQIDTAFAQFPVAVFDDIVNAFGQAFTSF